MTTPPIGVEVFANVASCVASSTSGTTSPAAGTSETWAMGTGFTSFPTAQNVSVPNNFFYIMDPADTTKEIVLVTSGGGGTSTWTVTRGALGTTPVAHATGATWVQAITHGTLENFKQAPGAATSSVTVANTTNQIVVATYLPGASDLAAGSTFDVYAFGHFTKVGATAILPTLTWRLYWGGSGSVGGTYTPGTLLSGLSTATTTAPTVTQNAPSWTATTMTAAGLSFDINGQIVLLSATSVTSNINWWYSNANNTTTTAANALTSPASPVTVSGAGPLFLTAQWSVASASNTLTATAPLIHRVA